MEERGKRGIKKEGDKATIYGEKIINMAYCTTNDIVRK